MESLVTFWQVFLGICGSITVLGGAAAVIWKVCKPGAELRRKVEEHERKLDNDNKSISILLESNCIQNECILQMMEHMISGNDIEGLRSKHAKMQEFIIKQAAKNGSH